MKNSWQGKKLGEVCNVIAGQSPEGEFYNEQGNGLPFYQGKKEFTEKFIGAPRIWTTKITKESEEGDILMSVRAPVGPINFATEKICIGRGLAAIRVKENIARNFIFYFLRKFENEIVSNAGAVFDSISKTQIENIEALIPSLSEQKRIVKILDEVFEEVGKVKENAEKNLRNSRELFESYLQSVFEDRGEGWVEKRLGDVCETGAGGTPLKSHKEYYENGEVPWLRSGEINKKEVIKPRVFITETGLNNSSARIFPINTVLIAMYGATAGQVGILKFEASTNQAVCGILPNKNFSADFLYYVFLSKKKELVSQAVGGAQPNISQIKIKDTVIPILGLSDQKAIVKKLDALSEETKKLEENYRKEIEDLEELKKSVLQKAFRGEL